MRWVPTSLGVAATDNTHRDSPKWTNPIDYAMSNTVFFLLATAHGKPGKKNNNFSSYGNIMEFLNFEKIWNMRGNLEK